MRNEISMVSEKLSTIVSRLLAMIVSTEISKAGDVANHIGVMYEDIRRFPKE